nr:unnamed protein product [Spirometra erinaceieuropaei]
MEAEFGERPVWRSTADTINSKVFANIVKEVFDQSDMHRRPLDTATTASGFSYDTKFNTGDARPEDFIASFESALQKCKADEERRHAMRQQVSSLLLQHKSQMTISEAEDRKLVGCRKIKNIVPLPADKGRSTVVMEKTEYKTKLDNLLMDKESYALSDVSEFIKLVNNINKTVGKLKKDSEWAVKSAEEFLARIRHHRVEADEVMVSFDVVTLFTSIPPDLAMDTLDELLREKYDESDQQLRRVHTIELLERCLKTLFPFNGQVYEKKKGTPMGSPLSGLIAEAAGIQLVPSQILGQIF